MNSIANNEFQIADLIAVRYKEDFLDYLSLKVKKSLQDVTIYPDTIYFLEKITDSNNGVYFEYYEDVLYALDIYEREQTYPFQDEPLFLEILPFPSDYLTDEEKEKGTITRWRLFTIFQMINSNLDNEMENKKVKKLGNMRRNNARNS